MNAPHAEFGRRYEPDGWSELDSLRLEVERLRDLIETRAQVQERLMRAMLSESEARTAEAMEPRIDLAAREAMAFAEQRLERQEAVLRALGRRFAEFAAEPALAPPPEAPATEIAAYRLGAVEGEGRAIALDARSDEALLRDAANLPIPPGGASRLSVGQVLEWLPADDLELRVLPHWRSRLAADGELMLLTLDGPTFLAELCHREDFAQRRARLFGAAERPLRNLFDAPGLAALLRRTGFAPCEPVREGAWLRVVARTVCA